MALGCTSRLMGSGKEASWEEMRGLNMVYDTATKPVERKKARASKAKAGKHESKQGQEQEQANPYIDGDNKGK